MSGVENAKIDDNEVQQYKTVKRNLFKKVPYPIWVFICLVIGFSLGLYLPENQFVNGLALSGKFFPKTIVTFATVVIFFLLSGATAKLIMVHKDKAGLLFSRIFLLYLALGLAALTWTCFFILLVTEVDFTSDTHAAGFSTFIGSVLGTLKTIITQQPLLQILVAAVVVGWIVATNKNIHIIANGIMRISDSILAVFKWLLWYYPIMIGCLAIGIPLKFGTEGIAYYGQTVLWVILLTISWTIMMIVLTKFISKRTWKQILTYYSTVYTTGFGTGGSYDTLAVNIISAERDLELSPAYAETSIVFGTVLNKSTSTMAVLICTITVCAMMNIPLTFMDLLLLVIPLWFLGLESPGVPGGAGFFMSPVIAVILQVPDPAVFVTVFITMYSGFIPMLCTAVNTTDDGFIGAMLEDRFAPNKKGAFK